jgi:methyltransferase (TIGR00027 family)
MHSDQASFTAEGSAFARASGAQHQDPKLRNPDWMAHWMLGPTFRRRALPGVWRVSQRVMEHLAPGAFFAHQARTKYFDALIRRALRAGVRQLVLLGAGFDTRAYRLADLLEGVSVFEVDHPATSRLKSERVARYLGEAPPNVRYLAMDFVREKPHECLDRAGFDRSVPSFFLWEGVCPYVDRPAFDATLELVAQSGEGSWLAFDYFFEDAVAHPERWPGMARQARTVSKRGEPYTFGVDPRRLDDVMAAHGLALEDNVLPAEAEARYLVGSDGKLWGHVPTCFAMACARRRLPSR